MYEVFYATTRVARLTAADRETAKRRFAAYALYDECEHIRSDVQLSFGDDAELTPDEGDAPVAGSRADVRAWLERREAQAEVFEVSQYEDPQRAIEPYLKLLATNDPWRLEGHGSLGRTLSAVPLLAELTTFDRRIAYTFDAARYFDYLRFDIAASLDPRAPEASVRIAALIDVAALNDEGLRQIASSYATIVAEYRLTARFAGADPGFQPFGVTLAVESWRAYLAHRVAEPARFLPPPNWTSAFPDYDAGD